MDRTVNAILRVYRGGALWDETLRSLVQARRLFQEVIVSFNGPNREQLAEQFRLQLDTEFDCDVLVTEATMSAVDHLSWIVVQYPVASWGEDQLVTILTEDDLICTQSLSQGIEVVKETKGSLLFGSWEVQETDLGSHRDDGDLANLVWVVQEKDVVRQLGNWVAQGEVTTISGMTFELKVLLTYVMLMQPSTGGGRMLSGIRAEYFLATQPNVKSLVRCSQPITQYQIHELQERNVATKLDWNRDELLFHFWLLCTDRNGNLGQRFGALIRVTKGITKKPSFIRLLPRAWTRFQRVQHCAD